MSWKIAIVVALFTALVTAVVTAPVADHVTKQMKVSNMEGGRGYLVVFLILVALVGVLIIGLVVTRVVGAVEWGQFLKAQGYALLVGNVAVLGIVGLCLLSMVSVGSSIRMWRQDAYIDTLAPHSGGQIDWAGIRWTEEVADRLGIPLDPVGWST